MVLFSFQYFIKKIYQYLLPSQIYKKHLMCKRENWQVFGLRWIELQLFISWWFEVFLFENCNCEHLVRKCMYTHLQLVIRYLRLASSPGKVNKDMVGTLLEGTCYSMGRSGLLNSDMAERDCKAGHRYHMLLHNSTLPQSWASNSYVSFTYPLMHLSLDFENSLNLNRGRFGIICLGTILLFFMKS